MPQMSPLSWLMLMTIFIMTMIAINMIMYFNKKYMTESNIKKSSKLQMNWKW